MAAGVTIKHKRKSGAFVGGELAAGEWGLDITTGTWYFSADGTTVSPFTPGIASYVSTQFVRVGGCGNGGVNPTMSQFWDGVIVAARTCRGSNISRGAHVMAELAEVIAEFAVPAGWVSGAMSLTLRGEQGSAVTNMTYAVSTMSRADGESVEGTYNAAQNLVFSPAANVGWVKTLTPLTTTGCAAGENLFVRIKRTDAGADGFLFAAELRVAVP